MRRSLLALLPLPLFLAGNGCAPATVEAARPVLAASVTSADVATNSGGAPAPGGGSSSEPPPQSAKAGKKQPSRDLRNAGWASLAIGGVAGLFAIGSSIIMLEDEQTRSSNCNANKVCTPAGAQADYSLANNAAPNVALWALTITGLGVGAYFILTNPRGAADAVSVGVTPNGSGANLAIRGAF
jgi:hypothetical protein